MQVVAKRPRADDKIQVTFHAESGNDFMTVAMSEEDAEYWKLNQFYMILGTSP